MTTSNLLTQLTEIGAIFAFTQRDISCMLQVVTTNRICELTFTVTKSVKLKYKLTKINDIEEK